MPDGRATPRARWPATDRCRPRLPPRRRAGDRWLRSSTPHPEPAPIEAVRKAPRRAAPGRRLASVEHQLETAGPHLNSQTPVRLEPGRQLALERNRDEALRQRLLEQLLARVSGHSQAQAREEAQRNIVPDQPVGLYLELARL